MKGFLTKPLMFGIAVIAAFTAVGVSYACFTNPPWNPPPCPNPVPLTGTGLTWAVSNDDGVTTNAGGKTPIDVGDLNVGSTTSQYDRWTDSSNDPTEKQNPGIDCLRAVKDVGKTTVSLCDQSTLTVTICNAYPFYYPTVFFGVKNTQCFDVTVKDITINPTNPQPAYTVVVSGITKTQVISSCKELTGCLWIELLQPAVQTSTYTFTVTISLVESNPCPHSTPCGFKVCTHSSCQIDLCWDHDSDNLSGYKIERSKTGANGSWQQINTCGASATGYSDCGLNPGMTYYYRIKAYNSYGDSPYSDVDDATTLPKPPSAPAGLNASALSSSQVNLTWQACTGDLSGYKIERRIGSSGSFSLIATVGSNVTAYSDSNLNPKTTYYYRVKAYNASGDSPYSAVDDATTLPKLPSAPAGLNASALSSSKINLTWQACTGDLSGYKIERRTGSSGSFSLIATLGSNVTAHSDTGLNSKTTYYYRISAYNVSGDSAYSALVQATTQR